MGKESNKELKVEDSSASKEDKCRRFLKTRKKRAKLWQEDEKEV